MEKRCEFCMALSPVVYCKADAAHLCLSCDARVHSANALSYRHPRTLVCESCRYQPAHVRCFDHGMFMCQTCDTSHHVSFQHQKRVISCYTGCPSAKDLAALWGFDLNKFQSNSNGSEEGSSKKGKKVVKDDNQHHNSNLILQQIMDLEMLQLSEGVGISCLVHVKDRTGGLLFSHNNHMEHFGGNLEFHQMGSPLDDTTEEHLSSPFSQLDNLTSSGNPLNGDSFWQCKSPVHNNEIWLQSMQDLGVCDEVQCFDDVKIPDVDLTFRNFEELFGSEQEPNRALVDDKDMECSFEEKHPSPSKLDRACASTIEDISGPSPAYLLQQSNNVYKGTDASDQVHQLQTTNHRPSPIRPSYSTSSFSVSRITGESIGSEYKDDELSPTFPKQLHSRGSYDSENGKENVTIRQKVKKVSRHEKQPQYTSPKSKSDGNKRERDQVSKVEGSEYDSANVT
ncbi:hypothetical protein CDL12_03568 [Handroanthus impetiginosus]|uniref:B box-type domain-containing protein n=1 Tax=Handroanthus impetiginosus TaxID=429701 RepID=A0A2G9I1T0_9LAMI|nr:hypothetical protein CDL12_03568 [Handroanthus impetiginosus]